MISLDQGGRGAADALRIAPPPALADVVEGVWVLPRRTSPSGWRVVADTHAHLILQRLLDGRVRFTVVGARSRYVDVDPNERHFTVGVRLAPGTLHSLTGMTADKLLDRSVHVADLFGAEGRAATRRAEDAETPAEAARAALDLLEGRFRGAPAADWRARGFMTRLASDPGRSVGDIAVSLGVSPRTLRSAMAVHVGFGPKKAQRVHRLLLALTGMRRGASGSRAAAAAGHADQSHLVNECVDLLGESPRRFLNRGAPPTSRGRRFLQFEGNPLD